MIKKVENILVFIAILFLGWIFISFLDVIFNNLGDCDYKVWNFFTLLINLLEKA